MVPTQDVAHFSAAQLSAVPFPAALVSSPFPSIEYLPAGVVAVVIAAFAIALVLSVRRRDAD